MPRLAYPFLLFSGFALAPVAYRTQALAERASVLGLMDASGIVSDLLVSFALFCVVNGMARGRVPAAIVAALLFGLLHHANFEHLRTLGGSLNWFYADQLTESTFLRGAALQAEFNPISMVILSMGPVFAVAGAWGLRPASTRIVWFGIATLAMVLASFAIPAQSAAMSWRQSNVLAENFRSLANAGLGGPAFSAKSMLDEGGLLRLKRALSTDVKAAKQRFALGHAGTNVLLVLVEGVSGAYLERVRERFGLPAASQLDMPRLNKRSMSGLHFPNFIANQRQTSRGEYAILCGDYPALVTRPARMTAAEPLPHRCLPQVMRDLGYTTVYLQAAPLSYNRKGVFMPKAGFERSFGVAWFEDAPYRSFWGVDDGLFFDGALRMISQLDAETKPWFLTLLTVGTHYPYWRPVGESGRFRSLHLGDALDYADESLDEFIEAVQARGTLDDTLVLVSSDESAGLKSDRDGLLSRLGGNWGTMLVLAPQGWTGEINAPHMQADVPLSILDYLGWPQLWSEGVGRSLFRRYPMPRALAFGNTYRRLVGLLDESYEVTVCDEVFGSCVAWPVEPKAVFVPRTVSAEAANLGAVALLRALAEYSVRNLEGAPPGGAMAGPVALSSESSYELANGNQFLLGGQDWWQKAGTLAEVDLELELESAGDARASARAQLVLGVEAILMGALFENLANGDRAVMRFDYFAAQDLGPLQVMLSADKSGRDPARVKLIKSEVRFRSAIGESLGAGARVHDIQVIRADAAR